MSDKKPGFAHLHVHTHYSLLDGANRIPSLIQRTKVLGMSSVAVTDHGNMFGAVEFYQAAIKAGIKPILGFEAYIAPGDRRDRSGKSSKEASFHLLLLAENLTGYQNLMKLSSIAYREGFHYRPRIDRETLAAHNDGLICTSTCLGAEIPQALLHKSRKDAENIADWYLSVFGDQRFFIEIQDHGIEAQRQTNPELIDIAKRRGLGLIATNDVHYLNRSDAEAHDVLCCISTRKLVTDTDRLKFETDEFYLKSPEEMARLFPDLPEAMDNTVRIAERCNVELDLTKRHTPVFKTPPKKTQEQYLRELVYQGARQRYMREDGTPPQTDEELSDEVRERIDYELTVISSKGFAGYFLIVWDFVNYARDKGIPSSARGSGCSAIVAYCLGLSQPDPIRYGLYFERFMDPDRDEMPDIDIDICQEGREEVIRYVREKYGHVAQIITFGTLKARAAIRDVCRVLDVRLDEADKLAKLVPEELKMTIDKALKQEPELQRLYNERPDIKKVIDISRGVEGLARHAGVHAAGVVIAETPLENYIPVYRQPPSRAAAAAKENGVAIEGADITQFDGTTVEKVGLLKMDFLGLRTLTILERSRQLAGKVSAPHPTDENGMIDLARINLADPYVFEIFARGDTQGVFQFESGGMRDVLMKMRPNRIEDLIAANALYRPGPMVNIDSYVSRKHGEPWKTPHEIMDDVLAETYGIIVYQEQVARLVNRLGDVERKRAFRLAKAISKKKTDIIEAERASFIEGSAKYGVARSTAEDIFNQIIPFGEYAFNKAHSTGYALVAYQTAYMKAYFPHEFMAAVLTFESQAQKIDEWYGYIEECRRLGIEVRPPDVNSSEADFAVVPLKPGSNKSNSTSNGRAIGPATESTARHHDSACLRFGLTAIKGVGRRAVAAIIAAREAGGPFRDIFEFCERVDLQAVNRSVIEALIKAGAFDTSGAMRKGLTMVLDSAMQGGAAAQADLRSGQMNMFGEFESPETETSHSIPNEQWSESEMLANEKAVLGFYVTSHPLTSHIQLIERFGSAYCNELSRFEDGSEVVIGGMITRVRYVITKKGRNAGSKLAVAMFEDLTGGIEAVVFSEELAKYRELIAAESLVFLRGKVDKKREDPSLRVTDAIPFSKAVERLSTAVMASLNVDLATPERLAELKKVLLASSGPCPVYLEMSTPDGLTATVRCQSSMAVTPRDATIFAMRELLGRDSVRVVGSGRKPAVSRLSVDEEAEDELETIGAD